MSDYVNMLSPSVYRKRPHQYGLESLTTNTLQNRVNNNNNNSNDFNLTQPSQPYTPIMNHDNSQIITSESPLKYSKFNNYNNNDVTIKTEYTYQHTNNMNNNNSTTPKIIPTAIPVSSDMSFTQLNTQQRSPTTTIYNATSVANPYKHNTEQHHQQYHNNINENKVNYVSTITPNQPFNTPPVLGYGWFTGIPPPRGPYFIPCLPENITLTDKSDAKPLTVDNNATDVSDNKDNDNNNSTTEPPRLVFGWYVSRCPVSGPYFWSCLPPGYVITQSKSVPHCFNCYADQQHIDITCHKCHYTHGQNNDIIQQLNTLKRTINTDTTQAHRLVTSLIDQLQGKQNKTTTNGHNHSDTGHSPGQFNNTNMYQQHITTSRMNTLSQPQFPMLPSSQTDTSTSSLSNQQTSDSQLLNLFTASQTDISDFKTTNFNVSSQ